MSETISMEHYRKRFQLSMQQPLPNGDFSRLFIAQDLLLKTEVALKQVDYGADPRLKPSGCLKRRIYKLEHPNLLPPIEHLIVLPDSSEQGEKGFELYVMAYNQDGSLDQIHSKGFSISDKVRIVEGLMNGLDALHQRRIGHGNLKPSNVLIQRVGYPHVRLMDYGLVKKQRYKDAIMTYPQSSLAYLAPEQLFPDVYGNGKVGRNADLWSLGMLVYELFQGKYLFGNTISSNTDLIGHIQAADLPKDIDQLPTPYSELVKACLVREVSQRPRKIKTLRRILAGEIVWRDGRAEKMAKPAPPDICCYNCGTANDPSGVTCVNCGKALIGPEFLRHYRSASSLGMWAIFFFTLWLAPIGFFYYGLYKTANPSTGDIGIFQRIQEAKKEYDRIMQSEGSSSYAEPELSDEAIAILVCFLSYFLLFGLLCFMLYFFWLLRSSNNLTCLGSYKKTFHPIFFLSVFVLGLVSLLAIPNLPWVPILASVLCSILPLLILQEIWRGSNPTYLVEGVGWKKSKGSFMIFSWWLLSMIFPILLVLPLLPTTLNLNIQIEWFYVTIGILAVYYVLFVLVILRIDYRQKTKYLAWARQGGVVPQRF